MNYGKVYRIDHPESQLLYNEYKETTIRIVYIQEKIDGSQFSFKKINGVVHFYSKNKEIDINSPGMFKEGVESIIKLYDQILEDYHYYGEYLKKPKHNVIKYDRVPKNHVILFDIYGENIEEAKNIDLEFVPYADYRITRDHSPQNFDYALPFMDHKSILGGQREGVVIKNYDNNIKVKIVNDKFNELKCMKKTLKNKDMIAYDIGESLRTEARWLKSVNRLKEEDELTFTNKDIGKIIKNVFLDLEEEESEYCKDALFKHYKSKIFKHSTKGLYEWYINYLNNKGI